MNDRRASRWARILIGVAGAGALAISLSGPAQAGISATKHNLGTSGTGSNKVTAGTAELCVFCHTPHAADVSTVGAPLWNKRLNTGQTYQTYTSSTMDARGAQDGLAGGQIGGASLACLSCHDGTQAMDNIINSPGFGGYDSTGGGTNGLAYTWTGSPRADADGKMTNAATTLAMLGTDLRNDHPIGIQYCGGGPTVASAGTACRDGDFIAPTNGSIGGQTVFWVDTGTAGRQKTDLILYNRSFTVDGTGPSVECASCHDPHVSTTSTFLRINNTNSAVCLACHNK